MNYLYPFCRDIRLHVEGRITPKDAARQERTAREILKRLSQQPGVILADGSQVFADRVLSAADGRFSQSLLLGKEEGDTVQSFAPEEVSDQPVQVNLGVDEDFSVEDGPVTYALADSVNAAGRDHQKTHRAQQISRSGCCTQRQKRANGFSGFRLLLVERHRP